MNGKGILYIVISVLITIIATLYTSDRLLPYPWLDDKVTIVRDIRVLQTEVDAIETRHRERMNNLDRRMDAIVSTYQVETRDLESKLERLRRENMEMHGYSKSKH